MKQSFKEGQQSQSVKEIFLESGILGQQSQVSAIQDSILFGTQIHNNQQEFRDYILKDNHQEFTRKLLTSPIQAKPNLLGELLIDLIMTPTQHFLSYYQALLECEPNINFVSRLRAKDPDYDCKTVLMLASQHRDFPVVHKLLTHSKISLALKDNRGENALFYALQNPKEENSYQIIDSILTRSPKLAQSLNSENSSLLIAALKRDSLRIVQLLLKNSADPNQRSAEEGNTVLHETLIRFSKSPEKMKDLILLFLSFKADPRIPNYKKKTAFDLAELIGFDLGRLVDLFKTDDPHDELTSCGNEINSVTKDQNSISSLSSSSEQIEHEPFSTQLLSQEMATFSHQCEKQLNESWKDVEKIYQELKLMGKKINLQIDIIGSYAYRLWTMHSDIDIVFINVGEYQISIEQTLYQIYKGISDKRNMLGIKQLYLNTEIAFPNIKIQLCYRLHYRKLDITIFQKRNNGQKYVRFIKDGVSRYPNITPIFYTFHRILEAFQLHNPAKGGIKTYAIYLMVMQMVRQYQYDNIGQILINLIYYYAYYYDYEEQINQKGQLTMKLNIIDPLNELNNLGGKKTQIDKLRAMFKTLDYGLRLADGKDILPYLFSLSNIFKQ